MNRLYTLLFPCLLILTLTKSYGQDTTAHHYLDSIKHTFTKKWPQSRTVNLVFHGHSVPTGYFSGSNVFTFDSYPYLTLKKIKENSKTAIVNIITTSIGGENAVQGDKRFETEVLNHRPDVLFIDYALNDRKNGLETSLKAWESMIEKALKYGTKVIILTPTPDTKEDILADEATLQKHSEQIRALAQKYKIGLVDSYAAFKTLAKTEDLKKYMSQNNHPNAAGHEVVAQLIYEYFK
jgi:lysophospholipase L1-like esterase